MSLFKSTKQTEFCPQCHSPLQVKKGKQGIFLGCTAYPACDYLKPLHQTGHIIRTLSEICPQCHSPLQLKQGNFGIFIGCSAYPDCHFIAQDEPEEEVEFDCPECKIHKLVARQGRTGKTFYGCSGYPHCTFTLPTKPIAMDCPKCNGHLVIIKKQRGKQMYQCVNKLCQHLWSEV